MKKFLLLSLIGISFLMTGCETTREITLNKDNSGTIVTTMDMSGMVGMLKMSGQKSNEIDKLQKEAIDTTIYLDKMADSLENATAEEKALLRKGKVGIVMNMEDEKMSTKFEFPFSDPKQIARLDKLSSKLMSQTMEKEMGKMGTDKDSAMAMPLDMPGMGKSENSIEDYFTTTYSKGLISRKLNKEKYAKVDEDTGMQKLKEMSGMGIGNSTLIINLPKPAKKAEGKNVELSDDKKKVTIKTNVEDFFDDATALEFIIEY